MIWINPDLLLNLEQVVFQSQDPAVQILSTPGDQDLVTERDDTPNPNPVLSDVHASTAADAEFLTVVSLNFSAL